MMPPDLSDAALLYGRLLNCSTDKLGYLFAIHRRCKEDAWEQFWSKRELLFIPQANLPWFRRMFMHCRYSKCDRGGYEC